MKRRQFLASAALAPVAATLPVRSALADAHAAEVPLVQTRMVGSTRVTSISDGFLSIGGGTMVGISPDEFAAALQRAHITAEAHPTAVNAYLVETGEKRILVDTGTGAAFGPTGGHLAKNLAALGVDPASIDHVVATHLHPDHIGGAFVAGNNPFTGAELICAQEDMDFWTSADVKAQAPAEAAPFFDLASGAVASFGERLRTVSGEADLGNGLTAMPLPGHTPGHMGVMIESDGQAMLIWGDIVHVAPVQFAQPEVTIAFDVDRDLAAATRAKTLDMAATDGLMVAGAHIDFPGAGYVSKIGSGYRWEPAPFPYG